MKPASRNKVAVFVSVLLALAVVSSPAFAAPPAPGDQNPGIAPINSRPHGKSYSEWAAEWQKTFQTIPASNNPIWGGVVWNNACVESANHVWMLYGSGGGVDLTTRQCSVSPGDAILMPILNQGYAAFLEEPAEMRTYEYLHSQLTCKNAVINVALDGNQLANPYQYFEESVLFEMTMPEDNIYGLPAGQVFSPTIDSGFYLFLNPMKPGSHTLEWTATWDCAWGPFNQNVRYLIDVKK